MQKRYVTIAFPYFATDCVSLRQKDRASHALVLTANDHGRKKIVAVNRRAEQQGIRTGMVLADANILVRDLSVRDDDPATTQKILLRLAHWCIRFTPIVMTDDPSGLILDATGCSHLWGSEEAYLTDVVTRLQAFGFEVRVGMASTMGTAWAMAHFASTPQIVAPGEEMNALLPLPPAALRLSSETCTRLHKLGLKQVKHFITMPRHGLRRRFGEDCLRSIRYALGYEEEIRTPLWVPEPWEERLPCIEPILTRTAIGIALEQLLQSLCTRLRKEGKGIRNAVFSGYRMDGITVSLAVGTQQASHHAAHLFSLFALKFEQFAPGPGIELFTLHATRVDDMQSSQAVLWGGNNGLHHHKLAELLDRLTNRFGEGHFHRYLPDAHYWPERSVRASVTLTEKASTPWVLPRPRPLQLLAQPEAIEVTAPIPDYPPMNFRHKGKLHKIIRADGPERIEQEWWQQTGEHRDYYSVEDEAGQRYWVFRSGHYRADTQTRWFLHGYFA